MLIRVGEVLLNTESIDYIKVARLSDGRYTVVACMNGDKEIYCTKPTEKYDILMGNYKEFLNNVILN